MSGTKFGVFEDIVEMTPEHLRPITRRLRELLHAIDPDACVVVRLGDRAATFGVGPKKMSEGYCYVMPHAKWINLGFYKGADLDDPHALLEGAGAKLRHIKLRSIKACDDPGLRDLIVQAITERKSALGGS